MFDSCYHLNIYKNGQKKNAKSGRYGLFDHFTCYVWLFTNSHTALVLLSTL